jgi:hypothetical protein
MAYMQSLPFFIARARVDRRVELKHRDDLAIPSFEKLAEIASSSSSTPSICSTRARSATPTQTAPPAAPLPLSALQQLQAEIRSPPDGQPSPDG